MAFINYMDCFIEIRCKTIKYCLLNHMLIDEPYGTLAIPALCSIQFEQHDGGLRLAKVRARNVEGGLRPTNWPITTQISSVYKRLALRPIPRVQKRVPVRRFFHVEEPNVNRWNERRVIDSILMPSLVLIFQNFIIQSAQIDRIDFPVFQNEVAAQRRRCYVAYQTFRVVDFFTVTNSTSIFDQNLQDGINFRNVSYIDDVFSRVLAIDFANELTIDYHVGSVVYHIVEMNGANEFL